MPPQNSTELKVVIVGHQGVGKTSVSKYHFRRFANDIFLEQTQSTVGASFTTKRVSIDDCIYKLQIWDTAGQERFRALAPLYFRGADAAILVFDIKQKHTFDDLPMWMSKVRKLTRDVSNMIICGNKNDCNSKRIITHEMGQLYAAANDALYMECSALNGDGVNVIFLSLPWNKENFKRTTKANPQTLCADCKPTNVMLF